MAHDHHPTVRLDEDKLQLSDLAPRLATFGIVLAVIGLGAATYLGLRNPDDQRLFYHAYLVAFEFYLTITLGAIFFVVLHHLARAGWSVTVRRLAEGLAANIGLLLVLFLPLAFHMNQLYEWTDVNLVHGDKVLAGKFPYLNEHAVLWRFFLIYFPAWIFLAWFFRSRSIEQDKTGDIKLSHTMEMVSAPGMILFGFTITFGAFDLIMSLNPHWFSTIFGVYYFAGCVLSSLIVLNLLAQWLQKAGRLGHAISVEHFHDLGKLTFAFVFFWGYIAFSQYMLIWYANMPEETQFFLVRQIGPWMSISLALLFCHLLLPFPGLLSRHAKRHLAIFTFWGIWLLMAHLLDLFWLIMPNMYVPEIPEAVEKVTHHRPENLVAALHEMVVSNQSVYGPFKPEYAGFMENVRQPLGGLSIMLVASLVIGMGGLYLVSTVFFMRRQSLVPLRDPRLHEALAFENI